MTLALTDVSLRRRARWHTLAAGVIAAWMLIGLGLMVSGASWWAVVHPFTLGALSTAVIVYSTHFTEALTRTPADSFGPVATRVGILQVAILLLLFGEAGPGWFWPADVGAGLTLVVLAWHGLALGRRLRRSLAGSVVVTVHFYLVAAGFLAVAVLLAWLAGRGIGDYDLLIAAHSRATVWGWTWLTVLGTIITLLPTLTGARISPLARARCPRALTVHAGGLLAAVAALLLDAPHLAAVFLLVTVVAAGMLVQPVWSQVLAGTRWRAAGLGVMAGVWWMLALAATDAVLIARGTDPRVALWLLVPALLGGGLLQLVTSVLLHLVPILRGHRPGADPTGPARLTLINLGGLATLLAPGPTGLILLALGLGGQLFALIGSLRKDTP